MGTERKRKAKTFPAGTCYVLTFCFPFMSKETTSAPGNRPIGQGHPRLAADEYYFNEKGYLVFTEQYHLRRGYCCKSQCKHCPFGEKKS
jgi:hypothetical protein